MCTAITLNDIQRNCYFERTMDFSYELMPCLYVCPKDYRIGINWDTIPLSPFGKGASSLGLLGDYTQSSRFVRSAFLKTYCSIPKTQKGNNDYTQYTSCMDLQTCKYFFKTYHHSQILSANLNTIHSAKIHGIGKSEDVNAFNPI